MLLHASSDGPDRPDPSDPEAAPERAPESERTAEVGPPEPAPDRRHAPDTDIEPHEPAFEIEPHEPSPSAPREPEAAPPDAAEIEPPDAPEPTRPRSSGAPDALEVVPPDASGRTPPPASSAPPPHPPVDVRRPADTERPAESERSAESERRSPLQRAVLAVLVIATAALIGYVLSRPDGRDTGADALARTVEAAGKLRLKLETDTPSEARRFVRDEFGWRVGVPVFEVAPLRGVAIAQTAPAVEVPVFLYSDGAGNDVAVFAYSYALLDQVPDRLRLAAADYDDLDDGEPFVRHAGGRDVVLWRDRDDIYVTVTDLPPETLTGGFAMAR